MAPEGEVLGDPAMLLPLVLMWYGGAGLVGAVGVLLIKVVDSMDPPQQWHASTDAAKDAADDEALARADALEDHHGSEPGERDAAPIIFFLLGDLAAADATAGHPDVDPSSELRDGLSALFATPVLSAALRDYEADADALLRDAAPDIDADWRTYLASPDRPDYEDPGDLNDGFFRWQMRAGAWQRSPSGTRIRAARFAAASAYASAWAATRAGFPRTPSRSGHRCTTAATRCTRCTSI
ncbi:hypothetical protein SO694_00030158 [Aureococcus anophagefferens]|uniref:Uncharacterized protein n=1 Tax=Aureococcus anophagefferens TaxID=44056 RepID=A0ABR1FJX5_AURAN